MSETKNCAACGQSVTVNYAYEFKENHRTCSKANQPTGSKCPKCQKDLIYKVGKYQTFQACPAWPVCDGKISAPRGKSVSAKNKNQNGYRLFKTHDKVRFIKDSQGYFAETSTDPNGRFVKTGELHEVCRDQTSPNERVGLYSASFHDPANFVLVQDDQPQQEEQSTEQTPEQKDKQDAGAKLYELIRPHLSKDFSERDLLEQKFGETLKQAESRIEAWVKEAQNTATETALQVLTENKPKEVLLKIELGNTGKQIEIKNPHVKLEELIKLYNCGFRNFMLVGPAGSGKSTLGEQFAIALNRKFGVIGITAGISESRFVSRLTPNFADGTERFAENEFLKFYEDGQVYMIDEVDRGDANTMIIFNPITANGHLPTQNPNKPIYKRHPDTVLIFTANTYGTGPDRQYVGANQLDAAFINRFAGAVVEVDYDKDLERALVQDSKHSHEILAKCWAIREKVKTNKLRRIWGTREIIAIAKLTQAWTVDEAINRCMAGWTQDEKSKCETT